ncbi:MAG: 4-alpha-glucanotransferase [Dysgonamonadaceae bacterium]|jgi:4-alpha-glucanotransferase|nr:4-alpha-glucanotransferase [Dysgonamonadaceae bacterium]
MQITFNIRYHTTWGQTLRVVGSIPELGAWNNAFAKELHYTGDGDWHLEIELPDLPVDFEYKYFLTSEAGTVSEEWQKSHKLSITDTTKNYCLMDTWLNCPQNRAFYSSAFTKSWFPHTVRKGKAKAKTHFKSKVQINVFAPEINDNQTLALVGNQPALGAWNPGKALILDDINFPEWSIAIDAAQLTHPVEYKFCIVDRKDKSVIRWETGENRILPLSGTKKNETLIFSGLQFRDEGFEWKCAGTVIPVFSLRSRHSFGIGDFADLKLLVDWLSLTSQKILQILPVNDTTQTHTWLDSYPYNAISIFALHPVYLRLDLMGQLNDSERDDFYRKKQKELNDLEVVDYEQVEHAKWAFFREIFNQEGEKTLDTEEFAGFFKNNKDWLMPYAAYSYLRDKNNTSDFNLWQDYKKYDKDRTEKLCHPDAPQYKEIALYYYLQFHLHKQLSGAKDYAHAKGVVLKGDIPIGISKTSIEAWTEPNFFRMKYQTGAPPDDFSKTGQNWGFPTYNWEEMEADRFGWWKKRFRKMSDYFDAYRIDHILGFFRIWEIPENSVQGLLGYFSPALPLSIDEIQQAGFNFQPERYTTAHINEYFLHELFGDYTQEVCQVYLDKTSSLHFAPKEKLNTQLKIKTHFEGKDDEKSRTIREGLYAICNETLFIRDKQDPNRFHPRISAAYSFIYRELNGSDKQAFDNLYWNYFYRRHNIFWGEQGYNKLSPLISATGMLACGEDLGMIPECVPAVMNQLQIFSLEIERMPKNPDVEFTGLWNLPYHSVCTTSTHDMDTIRMWWKENPERTQRYYNNVLHGGGAAPEECLPEICERILFNHLNTRSMLTIIPLQDWLSIDGQIRRANATGERINIPANPRHYWRYRMHLFIEDLMNAGELNARIKDLIRNTGR